MGLLICLSVLNLLRFSNLITTVESRLGDLINVYCGQELAGLGQNPYDTPKAQVMWESVRGSAQKEMSYEPGLPYNPILYPPWALVQLRFLHLFPFTVACFAWFAMLYAAIAVAITSTRWLLSKTDSWWPSACVETTLLVMACKGTIQSTMVGQPFVFFWGFLMLGLATWKRGYLKSAGIFIGLGLGKVSLGIPLLLMLFFKRQWKTLFTALSVLAVFSIIFFFMVDNPVEALRSYSTTVNSFKTMLFGAANSNYPFYPASHTFGAVALTEINVIARLIDPHAANYGFIINLFVWIISAILFFAFRKQFLANSLLSITFWGCTVCLTLYTQYYDFLWVMLLVFIALRPMKFKYTLLFFLINLSMFIPVNGILRKFPHSGPLNVLYFSLPLTVLSNWLLVVWVTANQYIPEQPQSEREFTA